MQKSKSTDQCNKAATTTYHQIFIDFLILFQKSSRMTCTIHAIKYLSLELQV